MRLRGVRQEHLTEIELELVRTGEAGDFAAAHLESCAACSARMERIEALATELGRPLAPVAIPEGRERAVVELARERSAAIRRAAERRPRRALRSLAWVVPAAAAAALALAWLVPELRKPETTVASETAACAGPYDVNRDGRVDILDALVLALAIEDGRVDASHDANRDGRVDRDDVDRVALAAVAIDPAGGAG